MNDIRLIMINQNFNYLQLFFVQENGIVLAQDDIIKVNRELRIIELSISRKY